MTIIYISLFSCTSISGRDENWEGFSHDVMRIIISEYFPPVETDEQKIPQQLINERTEMRAALMLASYVNLKIPRNAVNRQTDILFNRLITESLTRVRTISSSCDENSHCHVITEYNIAEINRELKELK